MKSLEAQIHETSTHGLNQVLSEVENENACWWACWDIVCLSRDLCVCSVSDSAGCRSDEVHQELLVGTAGSLALFTEHLSEEFFTN